MAWRISHLQALEAESIHIIREVASEFERPVMLYSIGKDSSVLVRLAIKAFAPAKVPFPLMHIDTFDHGSEKYTDVMKTQALKQALSKYQFDAAFGGARRDEEKSRAKKRV